MNSNPFAPFNLNAKKTRPMVATTQDKLRKGNLYYRDWDGHKYPKTRKLCCTYSLSYFKENHYYFEEKIGVPQIDEVTKGYIFEDELTYDLFKEGVSVDFLPAEICGKPLEVDHMLTKDIVVKVNLDNKNFKITIKPWQFHKRLTPENDPEFFI